MSNGFGTYNFYSWLRRGIAMGISRQDGPAGASDSTHAVLELAVQVNEAPEGEKMVRVKDLALAGPGEISGLLPQAIHSTWPQPDIYDVESNYFPMLVLQQPDLPWRYTPAAPDGAGRLQPWLCLIALKDDEHSLKEAEASTNKPALPQVIVSARAPLPKLSQAWAWAHVQVSAQGQTLDKPALLSILNAQPDRAVARVLCPRRLEARTAYTVFLVPVFARGRLIGLGQDPGKVGALVTSWNDDQANKRSVELALPVYHHWRFMTGEGGDFEHLVSILKKKALPRTVGQRPIDVSRPGAGLPPAASQPLSLEGALRVTEASPAWDEEECNRWIARFSELLNGPSARLTRKTRLRILSAASGYQKIVFEGDSALPEISDPAAFALADWDGDGALDLTALLATGTGAARLQILSGKQPFKELLVQAPTGLPEPHPAWRYLVADFDGDRQPELLALQIADTPSGLVEFDLYLAASDFQKPERHGVTALEASLDYDFIAGDRDGDAKPDLFALRRNTGSGQVLLRILSGVSDFQNELLNAPISLPDGDEYPALALADWQGDGRLDLVAMHRTSSGEADVLVLSAKSNFAEIVERFATVLPATGKETAFVLADWDKDGKPDLIAIQTQSAPPEETAAAVTLPLYGRWHAGQHFVAPDDPQAQPPWFHALNVDPCLRVTAALGAAVVQSQQQQLMASAWQQVAGIRQINAELRQAQLARETSTRLHARHLEPLLAEACLELCAPVHGRVLHDGQTVRAALEGSPIPDGLFDPQWRRVRRPHGPLGRRLGRPVSKDILQRLNEGKLSPASPPLSRKAGLSTFERAEVTPNTLMKLNPCTFRGPRGLEPTDYDPYDDRTSFREPLPRVIFPFGQAWTEFCQQVNTLSGLIAPPTGQPSAKKPVELADLADSLKVTLHPKNNLEEVYIKRLKLNEAGQGQAWQGEDKLSEVMAYPEFPQPMYQPLVELSQDWLLPSLDKVPPNSVGLLEANQRFIEAYMAGLNHEMARELLWNSYPTDQRGSYFRVFWDSSGYLDKDGKLPEAQKMHDILPLDRWTGELGSHADPESPTYTSQADMLVLVIRGDLLRRYPNARLYATKAVDKNGRRDLPPDIKPEDESQPIFGGTLKPDVSFFAFRLTREQAIGKGNDQGYFFVLQEQGVEELRFGLDSANVGSTGQPMSGWKNLSWGHLAENPVTDEAGLQKELGSITYIDLDSARPKPNPLIQISAPASGAAYTFKTQEPHELVVRQQVIVEGVSPAEYNGLWTVTEILTDKTEFKATSNASPGTATVSGNIYPAEATWHAGRRENPERYANAADLARLTLQKPVRVAIHASDLLPEPSG